MIDSDEVLPSFWSANYISIMPSEKTRLKVSCPSEELASGTLTLKVSGWNVKERTIILSK